MNSYDEDFDSPYGQLDRYDPKSEKCVTASGNGKQITARNVKRNNKKYASRDVGKRSKNRGIECKKGVVTQYRLDNNNSSWTWTCTKYKS